MGLAHVGDRRHTGRLRRAHRRHHAHRRRHDRRRRDRPHAVRVPHDAAEPIGLVATDRASGERVGIAYDLGTITDAIRLAFTGLDVLVIEANHDERMLRCGPYPRSVTTRIASRFGHLSNRAAADFVRTVAHRSLRHVVLAHLSEQCNDPALALSVVRAAAARANWTGTLCAATQDSVCIAAGAEQLSLAL